MPKSAAVRRWTSYRQLNNRLSAQVFAAPIAHLFNKSLAAGIVPTQWKTAIISPIPKVANPQQPSDFRPKLLKKADNLPLFFMVYLLHRLYGVDAPAYHSHHLRSHRLSLPLPFTPDLKLISFTNPFLHSHSYSFWTAFTNLEPVLNKVGTGVCLF